MVYTTKSSEGKTLGVEYVSTDIIRPLHMIIVAEAADQYAISPSILHSDVTLCTVLLPHVR